MNKVVRLGLIALRSKKRRKKTLKGKKVGQQSKWIMTLLFSTLSFFTSQKTACFFHTFLSKKPEANGKSATRTVTYHAFLLKPFLEEKIIFTGCRSKRKIAS